MRDVEELAWPIFDRVLGILRLDLTDDEGSSVGLIGTDLLDMECVIEVMG